MKTRFLIWAVGCIVVATLFFGELWPKLLEWLSPAGLQRYGVFHWGVLGLCTVLLWLKRKDILSKMQTSKISPVLIVVGLCLLIFSILIPWQDRSFVFPVILGWLGIFIAIFSRAYLLPTILVAIYGFSLIFPIIALKWLGEPLATLVIGTVTFITDMLGLPIIRQGLRLQFVSANGDTISVAVPPGCGGYETIGVFIALFSLMMLDIRLPWKKALCVFIFGLIGTWLQNVLRIVVAVTAGYYFGLELLNKMHYNLAYVVFPLWYALFVYVYFRVAGRIHTKSQNNNPA